MTDTIADGAVTGDKIADHSIGLEKLSFNPFHTYSQNNSQFGVGTFRIRENESEVFLDVQFNRPYSSPEYAVVAMTDRPGCTASLEERRTDSFSIRIQTPSEPAETAVEGTFFWIAVGSHAAQSAEAGNAKERDSISAFESQGDEEPLAQAQEGAAETHLDDSEPIYTLSSNHEVDTSTSDAEEVDATAESSAQSTHAEDMDAASDEVTFTVHWTSTEEDDT